MRRKELWQCPTCGQTFVSENLPHSCFVVDLDDHFSDCEAIVWETFDALLGPSSATAR